MIIIYFFNQNRVFLFLGSTFLHLLAIRWSYLLLILSASEKLEEGTYLGGRHNLWWFLLAFGLLLLFKLHVFALDERDERVAPSLQLLTQDNKNSKDNEHPLLHHP